MYIKLTALADKNGEFSNILVNMDKVLGMQDGISKDFFDKVKKDELGYVETYTEIMTRGKSFYVTQTVDQIHDMILGYSPDGYLAQKHNRA